MNPSPAATDWIDAFAAALPGGWASNTDAAIVAAANAPAVANPTPQPTVPIPYTFATLLGTLSQASIANVEAFPAIGNLFNDILAQSNDRVMATIQLMGASGRITPAEATALAGIVGATGPDPSWPAQIGRAQAALSRPIDAHDVAAARTLHAPGTQD